ncbi:MAG: DUF72 domain-containing protein, partial [Myxococcota bacterium]|nr:DUF72 domain-containing protein [Myxococcota bacterium]
AAFLDLLPPETPAAFEFRHPSWVEEGAPEVLAERGFAVVGVHDDESGALSEAAPGLVGPGPGCYLRLRAGHYTPDELLEVARQLLAGPTRQALVFFKHEDAGAGPRLAAQLTELIDAEAERRKPLRKVARSAREAQESA